MSADAIVSRELKSLQDELLVSEKERAAAAAAPATAAAAGSPPTAQPVEDPELRDQLRELANEVTSFFGDAEKTISAHPAQSVAGALLVGILIGRLMGRR
jgi:ElaB/YqjD/DUF883 family membrane-anchored ribosome-binding protein